jgi:serine/threonine protein kinase
MEKFDFIEKIGEGSYATVWKCQHKATGALVAVKRLKHPTPQGSQVTMDA